MRDPSRSSGRLRATLVVLVAVGLLAGCGTRIERSDPGPSPAGQTSATQLATGATAEAAPSGESVSWPAPERTGSEALPPLGSGPPPLSSATGGTRSGSDRVAPSPATPTTSPKATAAPAAGSKPATPTPSAPGPGSVQPPSSGGSTSAGPNQSPVIVASVSTLSGPAGTVLAPVVAGAQVWVKYINAKGGLNGHAVKYIVYDDGGDPARHRSQVQEAIEKRGVIAFVANAEPLAGKGSVDYITQKRVPVIGSETGDNWFYESPMYFPQASSGDANFRAIIASVAGQMAAKNKAKLGTITCAEVQGCADADRIFAGMAPKLGLQHVYRARASLAQPDFTAECLSARNASAEVFLVIMDTNSQSRVGAACSRQGYRPVYASGSAPVVDRFKDDPNLDKMIAVSNVFPWFQTGTAASDEYQQAMKSHGAGLDPGLGPALGWVSAKLFERAAAAMPEPPSAAAVLAGLWSLRGDTLGGLTHPLTFIENRNAEPVSCWYDIAIKGGKWTTTDGYRLHCLE